MFKPVGLYILSYEERSTGKAKSLAESSLGILNQKTRKMDNPNTESISQEHVLRITWKSFLKILTLGSYSEILNQFICVEAWTNVILKAFQKIKMHTPN